ncbi:MAG: hypothetical protein RL134_2514 [Actinomycetota bacterium]
MSVDECWQCGEELTDDTVGTVGGDGFATCEDCDQADVMKSAHARIEEMGSDELCDLAHELLRELEEANPAAATAIAEGITT